MNEIVFHEILETYLPTLRIHTPILNDFYYKGQLYIDIYSMQEQLMIQGMTGSPDAEFGLIAGQRRNYIIKTALKPSVVLPAYGYTFPLEDVAKKEIKALKQDFDIEKRVAVYLEHKFKGFF